MRLVSACRRTCRCAELRTGAVAVLDTMGGVAGVRYVANVGDVIEVPTAAGVVRGRITGYPLISFVDRRWGDARRDALSTFLGAVATCAT
jgi:hypothetical protein